MNEISGHSSFLSDVELRVVVALGLRLAAQIGPAPADPALMQAYVMQLSEACTAMIASQGGHVMPPFPGVTSGPANLAGATRSVYATELWFALEPVGTIFIVVISGRAPLINVAPPGCAFPPAER